MIKGIFVERDYQFKGYNDRNPPEYLKRGELADALNCMLGTDEITKRNGYTMIANDLGSKACQGLKGVRFASGAKELIGVFNGIVYTWTGSGNWSAIGGSYTLSTTADVLIEVANNAVYFFDGINTVPKYNGTTISTVAGIPIGMYARWFHNQMHVGNIVGNPNELKSSTIGDPETFTGGTSSDLSINPNDGDYITGLNNIKDVLSIFKSKRIWTASGFGTSALTLGSIAELSTDVGTLSHRSVVNIGNELLYISFFGGQPHFRSVMRTLYGVLVDNGIISLDIETTMKGLNMARLNQIAGTFDGRYVYWACPNGSSTTNNLVLVYDTIKKGWVRWTGVNASIIENFSVSNTPKIFFGESGADSKSYVLDTSTSDNGTAINFQVTSRRYGGKEPEHKNKYKWLYMRTKESGNYNMTIDYAQDGFNYNNLGTMNMSGTGSILDTMILDSSRLGTTDLRRKRYTIPKNRSYYMQFKMYDTSATSSIAIRDWELLFLKKRMLDE